MKEYPLARIGSRQSVDCDGKPVEIFINSKRLRPAANPELFTPPSRNVRMAVVKDGKVHERVFNVRIHQREQTNYLPSIDEAWMLWTRPDKWRTPDVLRSKTSGRATFGTFVDAGRKAGWAL